VFYVIEALAACHKISDDDNLLTGHAKGKLNQ